MGDRHHCEPDCRFCADDLAFLQLRERPFYEEGPNQLTTVDLFSGCGGMSLGLAEAARRVGIGLRGALAVDFDPKATEVYAQNFPGTTMRTNGVDVLFDGRLGGPKTESESVLLDAIDAASGIDILIGGPPCQGHSDLNNKSRRQDPRNELYVRMARAAELLLPSMILIENVPSVRHAKQGVVATVTDHLESIGYSVAGAVLDVSRLGVPQTRKRHVLLAVAANVGLTANKILDDLMVARHGTRSVKWAIHDLLDPVDPTDFDKASRCSETNRQRMAWFFEEPETRFDLPDALRPPCHRDKKHSYNSVYGRLRWDAPAQTITTGFTSMGQGRYVHPARPRTLTPHEAARIQGFPDFFDFGVSGRAQRTTWSKLIGNAVPPKLAMAVCLPVLTVLAQQRRENIAASVQ